MTDEERLLRIEAITELLLGHGAKADEDRIMYYGTITEHVPISVFQGACRMAAAENSTSWPPSPGAIVQCALQLEPGEYSEGYGVSMPKWYRKQLAAYRRQEQPKQVGSRGDVVSIADAAKEVT